MNQLRLLSLDFDGTLIGPWNGTEPEIAPELIAGLLRLRGRGVIIALNTGRTLALVEQALRFFPVVPDYALTTEREVYRLVNGTWADVGPWNHRCHDAHRSLFSTAAPLLNDIRAYVENDTEARLHHEENVLVGVVAKTEAEMDGIQGFIRERQGLFPSFSTQRNSVYLRFCHADYDKGSVLRELQRVLGIEAAETFVAGDNFNDLPMLNRACAHWLACPGNSVPEVKNTVALAQGFVAATPHGHGVIEALNRFFPVQLAAT
jgi:hydroxymethylpyrimidine pyrophosphatase-like HAD family hydrolase